MHCHAAKKAKTTKSNKRKRAQSEDRSQEAPSPTDLDVVELIAGDSEYEEYESQNNDSIKKVCLNKGRCLKQTVLLTKACYSDITQTSKVKAHTIFRLAPANYQCQDANSACMRCKKLAQ